MILLARVVVDNTCKVKLIAVSKVVDPELLKELKSDTAEELIMFTARVSNPLNQTSGNPGLLKYCIKHKHWSIFEQASMTIEIETSRAIAAQILRHRSFCFQEFSQRYQAVTEQVVYQARSQDPKNRQNSKDDLDEKTKMWFENIQMIQNQTAMNVYQKALDKGIAKEQARFLLPLATKTRLYMTGNLRSWITYIQVRSGNGTQLEHQEIANKCKDIFTEQYPVIAEALEWSSN